MSSLYPDPAAATHPGFPGIPIDSLYTHFMIFVGFSGAAAVILFLLCRKLQTRMYGVK